MNSKPFLSRHPNSVNAQFKSHTPNPTPCSLHPTPYTLHPTPYALHLASYILHPTPYALHPTSCTLHPTSCTRHPIPATRHPAPLTQLAAFLEAVTGAHAPPRAVTALRRHRVLCQSLLPPLGAGAITTADDCCGSLPLWRSSSGPDETPSGGCPPPTGFSSWSGTGRP